MIKQSKQAAAMQEAEEGVTSSPVSNDGAETGNANNGHGKKKPKKKSKSSKK
jgi:hypothetical protein